MVWSGTPGSGDLTMDGNLTIDQASGDPKVVFQIADANKFAIGVDDSDSDALVGSIGAALGTSNFMRVNPNGEVNWPLQSAFLAIPTGGQTNVASGVALQYNNEIKDQNGDYNNATYTYTSPIGGIGIFAWHQRLDQIDTAASVTRVVLETSNRDHVLADINPSLIGSADFTMTLGNSVITDMDSGDTALIRFYQTGGAAQVDVGNSAGAFSGAIIA